MNKRRALSTKHGFTVVELLIVIVVISILAVIGFIGYNGVQRSAVDRSAQSDLAAATGEMQRLLLKDPGNEYPATLPSTIKSSSNITLTLKQSRTINHYNNVTPVQNGVLLAQICQDLIDENVGKGVNQGGQTNAYITGCGNWNDDSMQITGWKTKQYGTPVTDTTLLNYADNFTTNDNYNKIHETVVRNFYHQLVERQVIQGGHFPVTSFWDSWASPGNGVMMEPLGAPNPEPYYCIEATSTKYPDLIWHVTADQKIVPTSC